MEDKIKQVLYSIYKLDQVTNRFNNKFNYMNLTLPLQQADQWESEKLDHVIEALETIYQQVKGIPEIISGLEQPVLNLIQTYGE